jgi:non-specific protein-tyrosine kinase
MLGSRQMRGLLAFLRERYDVVLVDAPPVLPVADAAAVASACDGVLLVLRHGKTRQEQVRTMFDMLRNVEVPILGTVFNFAPSIKEDWYYAAPDGPADQATDPRRGAAPVPARPREPMSR